MVRSGEVVIICRGNSICLNSQAESYFFYFRVLALGFMGLILGFDHHIYPWNSRIRVFRICGFRVWAVGVWGKGFRV